MYQGAIRDYPEVTGWPALCTIYVGRGLPSVMETVDASAFDLEIMNRIGDRFLDERGICWAGGPYQMTIAATPEMNSPAGMQTEEPVPLLQGSRPMIPDDLAVYEPPAQQQGGADTPQAEPDTMDAGHFMGPAMGGI